MFADEMDIDSAVEQLEEIGIYALQSSIDEYKSIKAARSSPTVLSYNNVTVYYDYESDTWILGGGVWWTDGSWIDDVSYSLLPAVGDEYAVGGLDGVGITLYDQSGSFAGCTLKNTWLYVSAGGGELSTTSYSPTGSIDSRYGVFHEFQDYAKLMELDLFEGTYLYYGKHMSVFAEYSSEFENYHGRARLQYVHTWKKTSISSVGVTISGSTSSASAGFTIGFTSNENNFSTFCPGETLF